MLFRSIHIPIQTTDESWFYFGDTRYNLKVGKAYIINSLRPHRPNNLGDKHRIHLFFHIPIKNVQDLLSTEINL